MQYVDFISIETPVKHKYSNHLLPEIVEPIRNYLFNNPTKREYYLSDKVDINSLIRFLVTHKSLQDKLEVKESDILALIIEYVEVKTWKL